MVLRPKKFNFTKRAIAQLLSHDHESPSKVAQYTDTEVKGLTLQVTKSATKTFYFTATVSGIKRHLRLGTFPGISVEEARATALKYRAAIDRGENPFDARDRLKAMPTFRAFALEEYMPWAEQYKRSAEDDESKLRLYWIPIFGDRRLCDITTRDIQTELGKLQKTLSPSTVNRHRSLLCKMFKLASTTWERIDKNPTVGITKLKENPPKPRFLSPDEFRRVMAAAEQESNLYAGALIRLLLLTGIRREEGAQARWEHVDLDQKTLYLYKTKAQTSRYVVLNGAACELLATLPKIAGSPWVFPGRDPKKPLHNPRKAFHRILAAAGVAQCKIHTTRHTFASLLVNKGASLFQVQQLLGHASPQTSLIYAHLANDTLRDVSQTVSDLVNN